MRKGFVAAIVLAVGALTLQAGLLWLYYHPIPRVACGDEVMYYKAAGKLVAGDPGWRPELLWPSFYPRLLALVMGVAGRGLSGLRTIQAFQILLLGACAVLLFDLTERLTGSRVVAWVASGWTVLFPPLVAYAHFLWPEIPHLFVFLAALWLFQTRWKSDGWCFLAGVALGLALLFKLLLLPFVPVMLAALILGDPRRRAIRSTVIATLALGITVAPVVLSNYRGYGVPVIADSTSFNLWVGLLDTARRDHEDTIAGKAYQEFEDSGTSFSQRNIATWKRVFDHVAERGPVEILRSQLGRQYFRLFDKDSNLTIQLPDGRMEIAGCGYRGRSLAFAAVLRSVSYGMYALLLVTAPIGFTFTRVHDSKWMKVLLLFFAYNLAIFLLLHVKSRYRIQFLPVFFIGSGCAVDWLLSRFSVVEVKLPTTLQYLAIGLATVVLLFLAFGGPLFEKQL